MALKNVRTHMIFIEISLYPLFKANISEWLFNNKICKLFLTKLHEIFLKHIENFLLKN